MSWMDSWSRPSKSQPTPAPFYLLPGGEATLYCKSCGRVISSLSYMSRLGSRKAQSSSSTATPAKYCSSRCRNKKPGKIDRQIEDAFVLLLNGDEQPPTTGTATNKGKAQKKPKGETRVLVPCNTVETLVFGDRHDPAKIYGRRKDRAKRGVPDEAEWKSVDMVDGPQAPSAETASEDSDVDGGIDVDGDVLARLSVRSGTRQRPDQNTSQVNGSVGGEKGWAERVEESEDMLKKRREGQKKANEREMVRCAARRGVAFGFVVEDGGGEKAEVRRKCEAVMQGKVVESSFAKGEWSIRWRE
ncbi:hypothetical protein K490DRAFT_39819 [Saccharata proteae CBS 121410]|uniref:Uncharacterized protein n=1 Tax=Saccharata proteae CBS 121410 TaxID=1314787 RepID=A0A9P4HZQ9_9PEZI|nr:hypothetical protein K490DRAFT_39819 [Saccharata proteae CBS 121410]